MQNRIKELDGLRGVAVVLVMALHIFKRAAYFTKHPVLLAVSNLTTIGWVGVDIFFTLSGFLITSILLEAKSEVGYFRNFYARRILRIFPLYYFAIAFVLLFAPKVEPEFTSQLGTALPVMLLYMQNWAMLFDGFHITQYLGITWSLAIEEQFYLLWPLIVFFLKKDQLIKVGAGYVFVSIAARVVGMMFWHDPGEAARFFYYTSFTRFEEIIIGALLAIFVTYDHGKDAIRRYSLPVFLASFAVFAGLCVLSFPDALHPEYANIPLVIGGYTSAAVFSAGLIGVFITHPPQNILKRLFQNPVAVFLGKYSYSIYLFHMTAALILLDVFWHSGMRGWKPYVLYVVTTYIATVIISLITWNVLEKHMLRLKKYFEYKSPAESSR